MEFCRRKKLAVAPQLIFNQRLDGWLTMFFLAVVVLILDMLRVSIRFLRGHPVASSRRRRTRSRG